MGVLTKPKNIAPSKPFTHKFVFPDSMFNYELKGVWEKQCSILLQEKFDTQQNYQALYKNLQDHREQMNLRIDTIKHDPLNQAYISQVSINWFEIRTLDNKHDMIIFTYQKKGSSKPNLDKSPALIYFHGGGCIGWSAEQYHSIMARYTIDCEVTVFNVEYRLAPEHMAPIAIEDAYAAVKHISFHSEDLGVDKDRIAIGGDSGGGYIVTGCAMKLAENNESNLVKLVDIIMPMTGNTYDKYSSEELVNEIEKSHQKTQWAYTSCMDKGIYDMTKANDDCLDDIWIFPNEMPDELAKNLPMCAVFTTEFDIFVRMTEELAGLLYKNGRLVEYCVYPGVIHIWYFKFSMPRVDWFWNDQRKLFEKFLF